MAARIGRHVGCQRCRCFCLRPGSPALTAAALTAPPMALCLLVAVATSRAAVGRNSNAAAAFRELSDAFDILSDPAERKYFDLRGCSRAQEEASESAKSYRHRSEYHDGAPDVSAEDLSTGFYLLYLLLVYLVSGFCGAVIVAGAAEFWSRLRVVATIQGVLLVPAFIAWLRYRKRGKVSYGHAPVWNASWAQLLSGQVFGLGAGVVAVGLLLVISKGLFWFLSVTSLGGSHMRRRTDGSVQTCECIPLVGYCFCDSSRK